MATGIGTGRRRRDVICSQNEVAALLKKAALGAGFPTGLADDLAAAGVALARRGQSGAAVVLDALLAGFSASDAPETVGVRLTFGSCCLAAVGASAFDLLVAKPSRPVEFTEVAHPMLLLGLAAAAAERTGWTFRLASGDGSSVDVNPQESAASTSLPDPVVITVLSATRSDEPPVVSFLPVDVDDEAFSRLSVLAARTYVPATEASRLSGAGAGLTDND